MNTQHTDEQQIREWQAKWMEASRAGDVAALLDMLAPDALFLTVGNEPMTRDDFAARAGAARGKVKIEGRPEIRELTVLGDTAICWSYLAIAITPEGAPAMNRAGNILSIFRRGADGKWLLWRDANLLT
jgi:uncharacterized protein (TIGR02246 family)